MGFAANFIRFQLVLVTANHHTSSGVHLSLEWPRHLRRGSVQDSVAVVNATCNVANGCRAFNANDRRTVRAQVEAI